MSNKVFSFPCELESLIVAIMADTKFPNDMPFNEKVSMVLSGKRDLKNPHTGKSMRIGKRLKHDLLRVKHTVLSESVHVVKRTDILKN